VLLVPPEDVAKVCERAIDRRRAGIGIEGIEEIVLAIFNDRENLRVFREGFQDVNPEE
jgi:hypothetical protein